MNLLSEISKQLDLVVRSGYWSGGIYVKHIEEKFNSYYDMHSVACSSGGMALELIANVFKILKRLVVNQILILLQYFHGLIKKKK